MKSSALNRVSEDGGAVAAVERIVFSAVISVAVISAISATGESLFTFLGGVGKRLLQLVGG